MYHSTSLLPTWLYHFDTSDSVTKVYFRSSYLICFILSSYVQYDVQVMEASKKSMEATSQLKSPEHAPMDVSEDEQDEAILKLNEDELRELQKVDSIQCIEVMRILPKEVSRLDIPLCRMVYMPLSVLLLPLTSRGWRLTSSMDTGLEHPCSMYLSATRKGRSGL
jgi:hypothetical protein